MNQFKNKKTKKNFEIFLNEVMGDNYGSRLRKNDPIQFNVGYSDWCRGG